MVKQLKKMKRTFSDCKTTESRYLKMMLRFRKTDFILFVVNEPNRAKVLMQNKSINLTSDLRRIQWKQSVKPWLMMKTKSIVSIATLAKRALGIFQKSKVAFRSTLGAARLVLKIPGLKWQNGRPALVMTFTVNALQLPSKQQQPEKKLAQRRRRCVHSWLFRSFTGFECVCEILCHVLDRISDVQKHHVGAMLASRLTPEGVWLQRCTRKSIIIFRLVGLLMKKMFTHESAIKRTQTHAHAHAHTFKQTHNIPSDNEDCGQSAD